MCKCYIVHVNEEIITDFVKKTSMAYFSIKVGDHDKSQALHEACTLCFERLTLDEAIGLWNTIWISHDKFIMQ